jgi:hypothetical protein
MPQRREGAASRAFGKTCTVAAEALGTDIPTAIQKGDKRNAAFDDWKTGAEGKPAKGTRP